MKMKYHFIETSINDPETKHHRFFEFVSLAHAKEAEKRMNESLIRLGMPTRMKLIGVAKFGEEL